MKHKWHKEIKAWADGAEIEVRETTYYPEGYTWITLENPNWNADCIYRIKPQPKEPQYLYIYGKGMGIELTLGQLEDRTLIGKIKLEQDDEPRTV